MLLERSEEDPAVAAARRCCCVPTWHSGCSQSQSAHAGAMVQHLMNRPIRGRQLAGPRAASVQVDQPPREGNWGTFRHSVNNLQAAGAWATGWLSFATPQTPRPPCKHLAAAVARSHKEPSSSDDRVGPWSGAGLGAAPTTAGVLAELLCCRPCLQ